VDDLNLIPKSKSDPTTVSVGLSTLRKGIFVF
jgi:hypothetical protein